MTSTIIDPIAEGISSSIAIKSYKWAPKSGSLDELPAAVVYVPRVERTAVGPDIPEDHLGARDWFLEFPVSFYFGADDLDYAQAEIADVIEAYIVAIDNSMDPGQPLNGECDDIKVVRVEEPGEGTTETNRKLWVVETRVNVVKFAHY